MTRIFEKITRVLPAGLTAGLLFMPLTVQAQGEQCSEGSADNGRLCNALAGFGADNIQEFITSIMVWGGSILATGALVMIIYAGARMMISQGDPQAVTSAKSTMYYAVAGFLLASFSYVIVSSIEYFLGVRDSGGSDGFFYNPVSAGSLDELVRNSVTGFLSIAGVIAILYLVIGGFRYVTAGNEESVKKARATITWAVIGLVSILLSYTIISVVINALQR